jgi:dethiobiotin synthetase/adenosylmethionine--8-amino-7-oxononanoate aminotransferase
MQIHARPLGNVIYFMSSLNSPAETLQRVEEQVYAAIDA